MDSPLPFNIQVVYGWPHGRNLSCYMHFLLLSKRIRNLPVFADFCSSSSRIPFTFTLIFLQWRILDASRCYFSLKDVSSPKHTCEGGGDYSRCNLVMPIFVFSWKRCCYCEFRPVSNERYENSTFLGLFRFLILILIFDK